MEIKISKWKVKNKQKSANWNNNTLSLVKMGFQMGFVADRSSEGSLFHIVGVVRESGFEVSIAERKVGWLCVCV